MRVKDYDLTLSVENKKVYFPEVLDTPLESYYHSGANCSLYNIDKEKFLLFLEDLSYLRKEDYLQTVHLVKPEEIDRLDNISYKYYRTPELWWLIMAVNPEADPFDLYEGQELLIPDLREFDFRSMMKDNFVQKNSDF